MVAVMLELADILICKHQIIVGIRSWHKDHCKSIPEVFWGGKRSTL